jgi:hypothetical protein
MSAPTEEALNEAIIKANAAIIATVVARAAPLKDMPVDVQLAAAALLATSTNKCTTALFAILVGHVHLDVTEATQTEILERSKGGMLAAADNLVAAIKAVSAYAEAIAKASKH